MDEQWLARSRAGDQEALRDLVHEHQAYLLRFCLSVLDNEDDAEDAVQEAFIAAIKKLDSFRAESTFRTWLSTIALNICRGKYRKRSRRQALNQAVGESRTRQADEPSPEMQAIESQRQEQLWAAISSLDEKHRLPIVLRYYHELPTQEIADILGIKLGTVHSRLANARTQIRRQLKRIA